MMDHDSLNCGPVAIIGAGAQATMAAGVLVDAGYEIEGFYTDDRDAIGQFILGAEIKGDPEDIDTRHAPNGIVAIASNESRKRVASTLDLNWITAIHPTAVVLPEVEIGAGTIVFPGSVIEFGSQIGDHVILNSMSCAAHDSVIGNFAHLAKANVSSRSVIGEGAFLGIQSTTTPDVRVGAWATVGAGAVVVHDVDPGDTVIGVPARSIGQSAASSRTAERPS